MRIRKNANISSLIYAVSSLKPGTILEKRACVLNQNPWDVMDFSPPSSPLPPPPPPFQDANDAFPRHRSFNEAVEASGRFASMKLESDNKDAKREYSGGAGGGAANKPVAKGEAEEPEIVLCCKTDGKSWRCKKKAADGNTLCEHHLSLKSRSYTTSAHSVVKKLETEKRVVEETQRLPRPKKASSGSNPYEFYYYSGFGPRWGKRRGEWRSSSKDDGQETDRVELSPIDIQEFESMDEEEDEDENAGIGRKRARKPVKARSLKSLM